jgi:Right handed beta helix region
VIDPGADPRDGDKSNRLPVFTIADPMPRSWHADAGVWLCGNWTYNWYDEVIRVGSIDRNNGQITLAAPALYSVKSGRFYALNLIEELDEPGEYYIDAKSRRLYFWPPAPIEQARIVLSTLNAPLLSIDKAKNVTFSGMIFENSLGDAIHVSAGSGVRIERCTVRNVRQLAIRVEGGSNCRVDSSEIYDTGTGGLYLGGGDRRTLTPAHHLAINNHIHHFSRLQRTGAYAITLAGVGNRAAHNLIHDAPHQAILIAGNDNVVEYNIIRNVVTDASDAGAVYKGRDPSCRGNLIRYNFFRDIGSAGKWTCAVYFDDGDGGDSVIGNIFLRCRSGSGFGAIFSHGGFDICAENNIFIDCQQALASSPWNYARWKDAINGGQDCDWPTKLLKNVDITSEVYTKHYPELVGFMDPKPDQARVSHARNDVFVRCAQISNGNWKCDRKAMWSTSDDPGFVDAAHENFRLRPDAELFRHLPESKPIPFEQIGPQSDNNHHH